MSVLVVRIIGVLTFFIFRLFRHSFRNTTSTWGEPLLTAMDVGHGYQVPEQQTETAAHNLPGETLEIVKTDGYLFDYVSLSVDEGSKLCILGQNGCGKSTLLRLLAKKEQPIEGSIYHPPGLQVGYFDQLLVDTLIEETSEDMTALSYLTERFPQKTEQDLRGELTSFGLNPTQATTCVRFLSGGERGRLCLAALMLENPPVLCMDNPTSNLDVESVEAMVYGLSRWNGTLVFISHDANFIRSLEAHCVVIMHDEGKLRRVEGGIDAYLKAFKM
jgi:ATPase subunit of ABC transporter with duplicated ATPase domains